jgi:AmmeMemoRadiSam system protein A
MNENQKKTLLQIAKRTVEAVVAGKPALPAAVCEDPELNEPRGCFVTLKNGEALRGCIGQFEAEKPLCQMAADMAVSSARRDPRFSHDRITPDELGELHIEISALTPMQKTDDPMSLRLGIDGIYITDGVRSGCFLPQVATETGWNTEEFLGYCCAHKAGLPWDAWKKPGVETYLFSAEVFGADWDEIEG